MPKHKASTSQELNESAIQEALEIMKEIGEPERLDYRVEQTLYLRMRAAWHEVSENKDNIRELTHLMVTPETFPVETTHRACARLATILLRANLKHSSLHGPIGTPPEPINKKTQEQLHSLTEFLHKTQALAQKKRLEGPHGPTPEEIERRKKHESKAKDKQRIENEKAYGLYHPAKPAAPKPARHPLAKANKGPGKRGSHS